MMLYIPFLLFSQFVNEYLLMCLVGLFLFYFRGRLIVKHVTTLQYAVDNYVNKNTLWLSLIFNDKTDKNKLVYFLLLGEEM
jgi:hypothetical protein